MSTSNTSFIPDTALLEKIANELFGTAPGTPTETAQPSAQGIHPAVASQQPGLGSGADGIPASVAGSGISPSAINQRNAVDLENPQTSLADPNIADNGIPASVAGSGASPSSFGNPVSSFPDFFKQEDEGRNGVGGETRNSTLWPTGYGEDVTVSPFRQELEEVLAHVHSYVPSAQLPIDHASVFGASPQYYFSGDFSAPPIRYPAEGIHGLTGFPKPPFDLHLIRQDFPILSETVNGKQLVWLDNAATTQKPQQVIERLAYYYAHENSNIHRAAHTLAARATDAYEGAREMVRDFINARSADEIIFVRGTTEAINLVAQSWGDQYLQEGDEIIVSQLEHHANIVPWQILSRKKGLKLKVIPVDDNGELLLEEYRRLLTPRTKLVSVTAVSNALGTVTPVREIIALGHQAGAKVLIDGAQSISHIRTDVQALDADWFVFSGHKIYGPTGIGVVYGKETLLNATQPWQGGGNMIKDVTFEHTEYHPAPTRFEAGTGNIADAVGLGEALKYVKKIGIDLIHQYESALIQYASAGLKSIPGLRIIGNAREKAGAISFVLDGFETVKIGGLLSKAGIAVRAGHHCAQPILRRFGLEATVRPSFAFYNTCTDIDALVDAVKQIKSGRIR